MTTNKINASALRDLDQELKKTKKISVCDGKYMVEMKSQVRKTALDEITANYAIALQKLQEEKYKNGELTIAAIALQPACVLKSLTDLYFPPIEKIKDFVNAFKVYMDMGIVEELIVHIDKKDQEAIKTRMETFAKEFTRLGKTFAQDAVGEAVGKENRKRD